MGEEGRREEANLGRTVGMRFFSFLAAVRRTSQMKHEGMHL